MSENLAVPQAVQKSRPAGVRILTIYALIFVGIVPSLLSVFMLVSGNAAGSEFSILVSLPISLGVIIGAIGAWKGSERGRKFLLVLITLYYVFIFVNNFLFILSGQVPDDEKIRLWGRVLRGLIYPAVYIWYFNKWTTKAFYN